MDDLRRRLEAYSEGFTWEPGAVHRMFAQAERVQRRRRMSATAAAIVIGVLGIGAAVRAFGDAPTADDRPAVSLAPAAATIYDGVYWTAPVTREEIMHAVIAAGYSRHEAEEFYFSPALPFNHSIRQGLVIQDGFWFQTAKADTGQQEAGWSGSFVTTGRHRIEATGYGCTITYHYRLEAQTLSLHVVKEVGTAPDCGPGDIVAQSAIFDPAPFVRESNESSPGP